MDDDMTGMLISYASYSIEVYKQPCSNRDNGIVATGIEITTTAQQHRRTHLANVPKSAWDISQSPAQLRRLAPPTKSWPPANAATSRVAAPETGQGSSSAS
jgi:hypothetical protein